MSAYYNELDAYAAQWLRNLIAAGHIAPGDVDERSIVDVHADDLRGYTQCHFFAGIGGWSLALRMAGWDDARFVWSGSCPCQPFSAAGKGLGEKDPRHLWPEFRRLIAECRPSTVFGEQVAAAAGRQWLAGVRADLEGLAYAVGAADLCAASAGAPHIRQRLWWVADAYEGQRRWFADSQRGERDRAQAGWLESNGVAQPSGAISRRADADHAGLSEQRRGGLLDGERPASGHDADGCSAPERMADSAGSRRERAVGYTEGKARDETRVFLPGADGEASGLEHTARNGRQQRRPESSGWGAESRCLDSYVDCLDGKARRIEPSIFPLAHGIPNRVGRLRAYGNAIVPQVAARFIGAVMECMP